MSIIITRILGGLGNQLFCYAAARRLALINNIELALDTVSGFQYDHTYQRHYQLDHFNIPCRKATAQERLEPLAPIRRFIKRTYSRHCPFRMRNYIKQVGVDFDASLLQVQPSGIVHLEGYWQSENYFKDIETTIRTDLQIIPPTDTTNLDMAAHIRNTLSVAVHVRFFDAPEANGTNAPIDYYARAVAQMELSTPGAHYFLFSDRPADARARIPLPDDRITCVSHNQGDANAYADLWLMTLCQHFIIANSTFSWWGAWLAGHPEKQVIAPGFELRDAQAAWGFDGLLPNTWIKL